MTLAVGILAGCTGQEHNIEQLVPIMAISPGAISFGDVGLYDENVPQVVTVSNAGLAKLKLTGELQGSSAFTLDAPIDFDIGAGDDATIPITFTPDTFKSYEGTLVLHSNDDDHEDATIPITGKSVDKPYPDIDILVGGEPSRTAELPELQPGGVGRFRFDIANLGAAPLTLGAISGLDSPDDDDRYYFDTGLDVSGTTIEPQSSTTVVVNYDPASTKGSNRLLHIPSNDPDEGDMTVLLLGNGGGDWPLPIAVCSVPDPVLLSGPQYTHIDGSLSTDPSGFEPLKYKWTVTGRPDGSDTSFPLDPDDTSSIDLYTDLAGDWEVQLVVTNQLGTKSEPAICPFLAKPADAIHVELTWDTPSSDLDLHLTEGGYDIFDKPEDCFYCNKTPSWGESTSDDDPRLDIDDLGGYGPENINVYQPVDGDYTVEVHFFAEHGDKTSVAHVKVWLEGAQVWDGVQALTRNDVWPVGTIHFHDDQSPADATFLPNVNPDIVQGGPSGCN